VTNVEKSETPITAKQDNPKTESAWTPLRHAVFRSIWIASVASNVGSTMHDVGAAWLMASLTSSAIMISLMQTASSLPIFLVALPAGALADLIDRRRLLLVTQGWMLVTAAALGILTLLHLVTPWVLLVLTFVLGVAGAMNNPAWQAMTPELVPPAELAPAVALNGVGFNLARAIGPALGGLIVGATGGSWAVFLLNAISFLGIMVVLYLWRRKPRDSEAPTERMLGAIRAGSRYVRHSPALHVVLVRTGVFILCGSGMWGLLPFLAKHELQLSAAGYGGLLACFGIGAVTGANILPIVRHRISIDRLVAGACVLFAIVSVALAYIRVFLAVCPVMFIAGGTWMTLMSTLNVSAQIAVPAWVRARALSIYLLVFQGGLAIGSVIWGAMAERFGIRVALDGAAIGLIVGLAVVPRFRLGIAEGLDMTPSAHWEDPLVENEPALEHGPVLVLVEYRINPEQANDFAEVMREVRTIRRRDGAIRWGLFHDVADPSRCIETFVVESWAEHLRQHERATMADQEAEARARGFHVGESPPIVSHLVSSYGYVDSHAAFTANGTDGSSNGTGVKHSGVQPLHL